MEQNLASLEVAPKSPHVGSPRTIQQASPALRHNLYANPHKALRLCLSDALAAAGRVDPQDDADVATLVERVRGLLRFCRTHLEKEEHFVHPAMEARRPGSSAGTRDDHRDHLAAFKRLESAVRTVEAAIGNSRETAVRNLYRNLAVFVADNLVHMHAEETDNNEALWAAYSDDELQALEQRLVASIPQDMLQMALRWMVPAMNPAERASLLLGVRAHAPAKVFEATLAGVQVHLSDAERQKLALALAA